MTSVELREGELICPECKGSGTKDNEVDKKFYNLCPRCWGDGKLDWVESICGSNNKKRFEKFILNPLKRNIFPTSIVNSLVDVQPMEEPVAKLYSLKPVFKGEKE